jgi:hypothetical protein
VGWVSHRSGATWYAEHFLGAGCGQPPLRENSRWLKENPLIRSVPYIPQKETREGKEKAKGDTQTPTHMIGDTYREYGTARAVVSARWDQRPQFCQVVPVVVLRPGEQEPAENEAMQRYCKKREEWTLFPLFHTQPARVPTVRIPGRDVSAWVCACEAVGSGFL